MKQRMQLQSDQELTLCTGTDDVQQYTVRVEKVERKRFWVSVPVPLPTHAQVRLRASRKDDHAAGSCRFEARVPVVGHDRRIPGRIALQNPNEWVKVQERDFVRMDVRVPVKWRLLGKNGAPDSPWRFGETVDLSGGGLSMRTSLGIFAGREKVKLELSLQDDTIQAEAEVIRAIAGDNDHRNEEEDERVVALNFTRMSEADRDRIVKFIFELQADLRRKGLA